MKIASLMIFIVMMAFSVFAEEPFNKLTECEAIEKLYQRIENGNFTTKRSCRKPENRIERALVLRSRKTSSSVCIERSVPSSFLSGYSCIRQLWLDGGQLSCFREINFKFIDNYTSSEELYRNRAKAYLRTSSKCNYSGSDTAEAQWTLFPSALNLISKFEFGFVSGVESNNKQNIDRYASHGFASLDSTILRGKLSAIEYFTILVSGESKNVVTESIDVGDWKIDIDEAVQAEKHWNQELGKSGEDIRVDLTDYKLTCDKKKSISNDKKLEYLDAFQIAIKETLEDKGLDYFSLRRLRNETGIDIRDIANKTKKYLPYGTVGRNQVELSPSIYMHVNEHEPRCTDSDRGFILTLLIAQKPTDQVRSDCGSIMLIIGGAGSCSRLSSKSTNNYIESLIKSSSSRLFDELKDY